MVAVMDYEQVRGYVRKKRSHRVTIEQFSLDALFSIPPLPIPATPKLESAPIPEAPAVDPYAGLSERELEEAANNLLRQVERDKEFPGYMDETLQRYQRLEVHRYRQAGNYVMRTKVFEGEDFSTEDLKKLVSVIKTASLSDLQKVVLGWKLSGLSYRQIGEKLALRQKRRNIRFLDVPYSKEWIRKIWWEIVSILKENAKKLVDESGGLSPKE